MEPKNDDPELSNEEMKQKGLYMVEKILKHKFVGEWRFLVQWSAPHTLKDAIWEPIECFIVNKVIMNEIFVDYC